MVTRFMQASLAALIGLGVPLCAAQTVSFEWIAGAISANDMSPDGRYVVGETDLNGDYAPDGTYLWDTVTDLVTILPPEGLNAVAVSDDGQIVLGEIPDPNSPDPDVGTQAAIWAAEAGWQSIGYLPDALECPSRSNGYELSTDGSVAVGLSWDGCSGRGFRWTQAGGMVELQPLANGGNRASVVSADGGLIGGFAQGNASRTPAVWDGETLLGQTLDPTANDRGEVRGMRDDGTVLLGSNGTAADSTDRAVKWTMGPSGWQRQLVGGGSMLVGWTGAALDIDDHGTIVGFDFLLGSRRGWIQPTGTGPLLELRQYISDHGGTPPPADEVEVPQAISTNGRYIVGHELLTGAWRITIDFGCAGDANGDGIVDNIDLQRILDAWASHHGAANFDTTVDFNDDDAIDNVDLQVILDNWAANCG
jgi:uncharacterized membrane protein